MPPKSAVERKAAERARKAAQGLDKLEVWAPKHLHERIKKYVAKLLKSSDNQSGKQSCCTNPLK